MAQLSGRYAAALFNLSMEKGSLDENLENAVFLEHTLKEPECQSLITHPRISKAEKRRFFEGAFAAHIGADLQGFLHLAVNKGREAYIVDALAEFIRLAHRHKRKTTAVVVSAVPLKTNQVSAVEALLSAKLSKQVTLDLKVDPAVIGGLYVQVDGYFVDRTIRSRLQEMKQSMLL